MLEILDAYAGCILTGILYYYAGSKIYKQEKGNVAKIIISILVVVMVTSVLRIYGNYIIANVIKISLNYIWICTYYYIFFKNNISKAITGGFLTYIIIIISDILVGIIMLAFELILDFNPMIFFEKQILGDFLVYGITFLVITKYQYLITELTENNNFSKKITLVLTILIIITIASVGVKVPLSEWKFSLDFIISMLTMLTFCIIGIYLLKQKSDMKKTTLKYQELVNYSDITNKLLEDYRTVSHEHKNQLSIIRGMINNSNQEVADYIDNLLEKRNVIKYQWIGELNRLPLPGLKGLINYKIMEMENEKLNISIIISKDVSKTKLNKLSTKQKDNLYSIIGIYLDNAIQSAKVSKKKEISLEIYKEKKEIIFILANSYKGNIDLNKIDKYGYTTKGKKHGVGLHIVKNILEESKIFAQKRKVFEDYFIQELYINLKEIK